MKNLPQKIAGEFLRHPYRQQPVFSAVTDKRRLIVDYSPERAKLDAKNRDRLVSKLQKKLTSNQTVIRKSKYLLIQGKSEVKGIDEVKIESDRQFDGLKGYLTNLENPNSFTEIIKQYHDLWQVEKAFRMSKHDLRQRPIFHYQPDRIKAHLLLCFVSLLVMRETERYLKKINYSLEQTIELLGKVGQGKVRVGGVELITESEVDQITQQILDLFKGH